MVKIGAAKTDTVAGKDINLAASGLKHRKIRGAAADIDDQPDVTRPAKRMTGQSRCLGLKHEIDPFKTGSMVTAAKVTFRTRIPVRIIGVKMHRTARQNLRKALTGLRLGPLLHCFQKGRDDIGQSAAFGTDHPGFVKEAGA